jgi:hypothetical protein
MGGEKKVGKMGCKNYTVLQVKKIVLPKKKRKITLFYKKKEKKNISKTN